MSGQQDNGSAPWSGVISPYARSVSSTMAQGLRLTEAEVAEQMSKITQASREAPNRPRHPLAAEFKQFAAPDDLATGGHAQAVVSDTSDSSYDSSSSDSDSTDVEEPSNVGPVRRVVSDMGQRNAQGDDDSEDSPASQNIHFPLEPPGRLSLSLTQAADGRPYSMFQRPDGTLEKGWGVAFPTGYRLHDHPVKPYICPIRDCRHIFQTLQRLGGHFGAGHCGRTLNDNGDGTLSHLGHYSNSKGTSPAIVISRSPLSRDAPPLHPPYDPSPLGGATTGPDGKRQTPVPLPMFGVHTFRQSPIAAPSSAPPGPLKRQSSNSSLGGPAVWKRATTNIAPRVKNQVPSYIPPPLIRDREAELVAYLHGYLSPEQENPLRGAVRDLVKLPRRRGLPDKWLRYHSGTILDTTTYFCTVVFMVGDSIKGESACQGPNVKTARLSTSCVVLPPDVDQEVKDAFSKFPTCVGCKYHSYLQRQANRCRFVLREPQAADTPDSMIGNVHGELMDVDADRSGSQISEPAVPVPKELRRRIDPPVSAGVHQPNPQGSLKNGGGAVLQMEDWELAPGRFPSDASGETFAWSGAYMTQGEPIGIADDIGVNVLVIKSGSNKRWSTSNSKIRICYVAEGKLRVTLGDQKVEIGRRGTFKISPGQSCVAENRQYVDAEVSCTTIDNYEYVASTDI